MSQPASRRAFLRGHILRTDKTSIHPPGAEPGFADLCTQCGECRMACPEDLITFDTQGWPVVDLNKSRCTFCGNCANACPTGALNPDMVDEWPWRAKITASCLSMNGISCRVCQDICDQNAIRFKLQMAGRARPVLDTDQCTGCGACASACPTGSVSFERHTQSLEASA